MIKNTTGLVTHLATEIKKQTDVAIVGLSGGADSTCVAVLCMMALGPENVVGVHMPYGSSDIDGTKFNARSVRLARKLGIMERTIPVTDIANAICNAIDPVATETAPMPWHKTRSRLDEGNARARARMCVLYGLTGLLSHEDYKGKRIRVVGTGNLSEDFIGYDTKGGDALTDFHPIGRLFKSEVYQLLDAFKLTGTIDEEHIDRVPSAGLWEGQTDEGELGHTYNEMEPAIRGILLPRRAGLTPVVSSTLSPTEQFVLQRHLGNKHKHDAIPSFDISDYVD